MIFSSGVRVVTPAYYATKNTWFPAAVSTFCLAVHIVLAPQLMKYHGVNGLMMSTISSAFLNLTLLLLFYRKYIGEFDYKKFFGNVTVFALVALVTAFAGNIFYVLKPLLPEGKLFLALNLAVSIPAAVGVFVTVGFVFKVKAVRDVADRIVSKIKRKLKK
jgi:putative peptidoglycan lipid II flippase